MTTQRGQKILMDSDVHYLEKTGESMINRQKLENRFTIVANVFHLKIFCKH